MLVSAHNKGDANGHLMGIDPRNPSKVVGIVALGRTHTGALGLNDEWLFVDGQKNGKSHSVNAYRLDALRSKMKPGKVRDLKFTARTPVYGASFLTVDGRETLRGQVRLRRRPRLDVPLHDPQRWDAGCRSQAWHQPRSAMGDPGPRPGRRQGR